MLVVTGVAVVVVVAVMFFVAGNQLDRQLDERVSTIQKEFDASLNRVRDDVRKELAASGGLGTGVTGTEPAPIPTATPFPTATFDPGLEPEPTPAATFTPAPTITPAATEGP
jgi:hypothetical protein